ncbi:MAG: SLBB domain-containing protein [Micavibrio sp.]|nr:SLBB domain-containing protein [Micavibrio sp.]
MSYKRLLVIGSAVIGIPALCFAQNYAQPVVAPWSAQDTPTQNRIRHYENFKSVRTAQLSQTSDHPYNVKSEGYAPYPAPTPPIGNPHRLHQAYLPPAQNVQGIKSPLERMYESRIIDNLDQFGYEMFGVPDDNLRHTLDVLAQKSPSMPSGAVQDDFVLGIGDELSVVFTGQRTDRSQYTIDSNGMIVIDDLPPIPAAGRSIGQVRISLEAAAAQLYNTEVSLSLASVRQIGVLVVGHVKKPGRRTLTVFHTVLDALMDSGGIDKTGSLRQIKLVRSGRATYIDLYSLLMHGATNMDLQLKDGDRLIIPPIGPTVAVTGEVKRPGIFEILPDFVSRGMAGYSSEKLSLNEMLSLGGGILSPGDIRYLKLSPTSLGEEKVEEIADPLKPAFDNGSILMVSKGQDRRAAVVELDGHTLRPGLHALSDNKTLSQLIPSANVLGPDIYPLIGVIERWNAEQLTRQLIDFPLQAVLAHNFDRNLEDGDVIHLFSNAQIKALQKSDKNPQNGIQNVSLEVGSRGDLENPALDLLQDDVLAGFLKERSAFIRGAVRKPGLYPLASGMSLNTILAAAGGAALEADTANIELTTSYNGPSTRRMHINFATDDPREIMIGPGDSIHLKQKFEKIADNSVLIMGEVKAPGRYDLLPGDKISDLLARAGGLTGQSYPFGAIFSRESERKAEEIRFDAQADTIEQSIASAIHLDNEKVSPQKIAEARGLAQELRNAKGVGRITVEADPGKLATNPELDMLLESGDKLFIPKRGLTVRVSGEILSPASLQFREKKASLDYIHEAGGFTYHADKERAFVIYPDGAAQPLEVSSWNYNPVMIPPGSTIVVPRDPKPFDFIQSAKDVSQILSNIAVTAIFVDDLGDD